MKRKVVIALGSGLFFYALSDVLLWQRVFEAHNLYQFDEQYQTGHVATLIALIGTGMVLLWDAKGWAVWYGAAFYTLAFGGVCDVLYYLLDGRHMPANLPWLDDSRLIPFKPVTASSLLLSAGVWVALWIGSLVAIKLWAYGIPYSVNRLPTAKRPEVGKKWTEVIAAVLFQ